MEAFEKLGNLFCINGNSRWHGWAGRPGKSPLYGIHFISFFISLKSSRIANCLKALKSDYRISFWIIWIVFVVNGYCGSSSQAKLEITFPSFVILTSIAPLFSYFFPKIFQLLGLFDRWQSWIGYVGIVWITNIQLVCRLLKSGTRLDVKRLRRSR